MNIQPVGTKMLVLPLEKKEEKLESGLVMPETANADLREGEILAVSKELEGLYKVGDIVLYPDKKGVAQLDGGRFLIWLDADKNKEEIWGIVQ